VRVSLSSHSNPLLTLFSHGRMSVHPFNYHIQIHCSLQFRFVSETVCPSIFLKCSKLTAYSTFVSKVGPSALSHLNTLLTPFLSPRLCVQPLSSHSNPLLTLSLPIVDCQWVGPSLFLQLNPGLIFVSQAHMSFSLHLNPLLTPFLYPRGCVHFLSHT